MPKLSRIYTRTGDKGLTRLVGGTKISKGHLRLEAYGSMDELNACIGLVRSTLTEQKQLKAPARRKLGELLLVVQQELFTTGSCLATPASHKKYTLPLPQTSHLEKAIDSYQKSLPVLSSFVLAGDTILNALFHQCRTVCRRVERNIVRLGASQKVAPLILQYVNRLSDLFFVLARFVSCQAGSKEILWQPPVSGLCQGQKIHQPLPGEKRLNE